MVVNNASSDLQWQVIRKNSAFIRRQRGINKHFSREKFNLKGVNSPRFNGLINKFAVDINLDAAKKEIVVTTKKPKAVSTPANSTTTTKFQNSTRAVKSVEGLINNTKPEFRGLAKRRVSQLIRSTKPRKNTNRRAKTE